MAIQDWEFLFTLSKNELQKHSDSHHDDKLKKTNVVRVNLRKGFSYILMFHIYLGAIFIEII